MKNNNLISAKAFQILSRTGRLFRSKPRAFSRKRLLSHGSVRHRKNNAFSHPDGSGNTGQRHNRWTKKSQNFRCFQEDRLLEGYDVLTNLRFVCRQRLSDAELSAYAAALLPQNALFQPVCEFFRRHEAPIVFAARPARSLRPFDFR